MKYLTFSNFFKFYTLLFSGLVLFNIGVVFFNIITHNFNDLFSNVKSLVKFSIYLLLGLNYEDIINWLDQSMSKNSNL
ncbi:hypothetical protein GCM10027155_03780 [Acinetobacter apis]|uniref:Uncharacterized protein n=1 Tax=Acinetobacter apis TaxID=1229165 RepID=A0A217ED99_9GAMM|nr:hypothetical protein SAMN05444584_0386 [Acinetobacter apis]